MIQTSSSRKPRLRTRRFIDAPTGERCEWTIRLRDGSEAQCGRKRAFGARFCTQHAKMEKRGELQPSEPSGEVPTVPIAPRRIAAGNMVELKAAIYRHHGWVRKAGESMSARIKELYEVTANHRAKQFVATPKGKSTHELVRLQKNRLKLHNQMLYADTMGSNALANGNGASERGQKEKAQRYYDRGQYWLDRSNDLRDRIAELDMKIRELE